MIGWLRRGRGARAKQLLGEGAAHEDAGRIDEAVHAYGAVLETDPGNEFALFNLGRIDFLRGELEAARARLEHALKRRPGFADAHILLASVREALGDLPAALSSLESALRAQPGHEGALQNLGLLQVRLGDLCFAQGRLAQAEAHFTRAAALRPQLAGAHAGLGQVHAARNQPAEAVPCLRRALEIDSRLVHVLVNLGNALASLGRTGEALASYDAALAVDPENAAARWCRAISVVPAIRDSAADARRSREAFAESIADLDRWFDAARTPRGAEVVGLRQPFSLAYQEERNTDLLRAYGRLCSRLMQARAGDNLPPMPRPTDGRLRVGIVSRQYRRHSVWHALMRGWFERLDPDRFALLGFSLGVDADDETSYARSRAASFEEGPRTVDAWAETIRTSGADVLIYPEVGMDPTTLRLASLRLAPRQLAAWGHPETTGLPTIDAFLSADGLEPEGAQANYTETLIRLPHLGCHVRAEDSSPDATLGMPSLEGVGPLLICPGTPFKYAPEHDAVLVRVARELGRCRLVFFAHGLHDLSTRTQARISAAFAAEGLDAADYVSVLDWLPRARFLALLERAHAMLDTIGFSGFNTALMAVQRALPVVAYEGRFLRGRLASGVLRHMGLDALVASDEASYADLAVRLCRDAGFHASVRASFANPRASVFEDDAPVQALASVLLEHAP